MDYLIKFDITDLYIKTTLILDFNNGLQNKLIVTYKLIIIN